MIRIGSKCVILYQSSVMRVYYISDITEDFILLCINETFSVTDYSGWRTLSHVLTRLGS